MAHSENASPNAHGPPAPSVHVHPRATLDDDGDIAFVTLRVTAPAGADVLEAFIYLVQDGQQTQFVPFQPGEDGHPERIVVQLPAADLELGDASVSGYFLLSTGQAVNITGDVHLAPVRPEASSAAADGWVFG